jgi:hypothetical protein
MAKKSLPPERGPSKAYLVSFGDTMTSLLAFFIVLVSLAEEQTGANLYSGTGSFVSALNSFGVPGTFHGDRSNKVLQFQEPGAVYIVEDPDGRTPDNKDPLGPDEESNDFAVIDREEEDFQRLLGEMERLFRVRELPATVGESSFDFFDPIPEEPPFVTPPLARVLQRVLPVLYRGNYRVEVIVWATTPSPTAWHRAANQSLAIASEIAHRANLTGTRRSNLSGVGRAWLYSDVKRPVLSFRIQKIQNDARRL